MRKLSHLFILFFFLQILQINLVHAQASLPADFPKIEITADNSPSDGYLFITPMASGNGPGYITIMDRLGTPVYYRYVGNNVSSFKLQPNGYLSYTVKNQDVVCHYIMDSSFVVTDSVKAIGYPTDEHDLIAKENGHYLLLAKDTRTIDLSSVVIGGKVNAQVTGCVIQVLDQDKNIVFEWNSFDHLQIKDSYADLTAQVFDYVGASSMDIDSDGSILLMSRYMNELTKINRQTGEIIWQMGGRNNQFSFGDASMQFSGATDAGRTANGNIIVFDNGLYRNDKYSRALEYVVDENGKTVGIGWNYDAGKKMYSPESGNVQKLANENLLVGFGNDINKPAIMELHPDSSIAFSMNFENGISSCKAFKFPWRTNLFTPNRYSVIYPEWDGYTYFDYILTLQNNSDNQISISGYSNHTQAFKIETSLPVQIPSKGKVQLVLRYEPNYDETGVIEDILTLNSDISSDTLVQRISQQIRLYGSKPDDTAPEAAIPLINNLNVPTDTLIYVHFSEAVRRSDNSEFNYRNIDSVITFKKDNSSGMDVPFDAVFSTDKKLISISPKAELNHGQIYYISLAGDFEDFYGNTGTGVSGTFTTKSVTGIKTFDKKDLVVFPNPGNGKFQINFNEISDFSIKITDLSGHLILNHKLKNRNSFNIDLSGYPSGTYILSILEKGSLYTRNYKLIKNQEN